MLKVNGPPLGAEFIYIPSKPTIKIAEPPINIKVSFIAEYSFGPVPHIPINKYIGITATS